MMKHQTLVKIHVKMAILFQSGCQLRSFDSYPSSGSANVYFDGSPMYNLPQPDNSADMVVSSRQFYQSMSLKSVLMVFRFAVILLPTNFYVMFGITVVCFFFHI